MSLDFAKLGQTALLYAGLAATSYTGLTFMELTPATQRYVQEQVQTVRKELYLGRAETLDTRTVVFGLRRNDLIRERIALEDALSTQKTSPSRSTMTRRLENIISEIEAIDRQVKRLEEEAIALRNK